MMFSLQERLALAIILIASLSRIQAATQTYCSSFNTGSSFSPIYGQWTSLSSCQGNCTNAGSYALAVVQGNNCWCSNYVPQPRLAVSRCGKACPGWPYENCGDVDNNLFGYLALGPAAAGTSGSSASTQAATSTPPPSTIVVTSQSTVVSTSVSTQVVSIFITPSSLLSSTSFGSTATSSLRMSLYTATTIVLIPSTTQTPPGSTSVAPVTVLSTIATTERITVIPTPSTVDPSSEPTTEPTSGSTSVWPSIVTISGAPTTKYITSVVTAPAAVATSEQLSPTPQARSNSLSGGAIAGIVIGALAGLAILAALVFFMCFRRRHDEDGAPNTLDRNSSVLSKVGLVRKRTNNSAPPSATIPEITPSMMQRTPTLPAFTDSRMNPNLAGSWRSNTAGAGAGLGLSHANDSQASLGSLQDARDYSRPLEVRNPDPV